MFSLKIVSPTEIIFEGDVDFVVVPGNEGQLGILPHHAPLLSILKRGQIRLKQKAGAKTFDIPGGFLEVLKNKVTVLINSKIKMQKSK